MQKKTFKHLKRNPFVLTEAGESGENHSDSESDGEGNKEDSEAEEEEEDEDEEVDASEVDARYKKMFAQLTSQYREVEEKYVNEKAKNAKLAAQLLEKEEIIHKQVRFNRNETKRP